MVGTLKLLRQWKHLTLLASLLGLIFVQPVARTGGMGLIVFDILLTIVTVVIFFVVFERHSTRIAALMLAAPMICIHWLERLTTPNNAFLFVADHAIAALFLGFAVTVILRGIFKTRRFQADDLLGVVCGYLLAGLAWGSLYNLAETVSPNAFSVRSDMAWQLTDQAARRDLFDNFSFVTLTCSGDNRVAPIGQTASSLTWLEAIFGEFYMAVVVAQLVGLKLSQSAARSSAAET